MGIKKIELSKEDLGILRTLARSGAMSPGRVSAATSILPGETLKLLKALADAGMVILRDDPASADGRLVGIAGQARDFLELDA